MTKDYKKHPGRRFCGYCSAEMVRVRRGAEENMMFYGDSPTIPLAKPYNQETGERNYCWYYKCPSIRKNTVWTLLFGSSEPHDEYFVDEVFN